MLETDYSFEKRVVVFLDVLGFKRKLNEFEEEASHNVSSLDFDMYVSLKAIDFIETFKKNIDQIKTAYGDKLNYYLFSDNMCFSIELGESHDILIEILFSVCDLFESFAEKGYFLRGAADVGLFINNRDIAIGIPLVNSYELESEEALYPRFLLSANYIAKINEGILEKRFSEKMLSNRRLLIKGVCENYQLNIFGSVITRENLDSKYQFLKQYRDSISQNLTTFAKNENIHRKYKLLDSDFCDFIKVYLRDFADLDSGLADLSEDEIGNFMEQLKGLINV